MSSSGSSSNDELVHHADMERAFAVLDLASMLAGNSVDMYVQAVKELGSIFSNDMFWIQASKNLVSEVMDCGMQAINACDFDNQWCLGALNAMMKAVSKQKACQKSKKTKLFAAFRTAGIMHSRKRKKQLGPCMELPSELLAEIFQNLDPISLAQCMVVCKQWNEIVSSYDASIWRSHFRVTFGDAKTRLMGNEKWAKTFSTYASRFPFMLIPYQTKRIGIRGYVRIVHPSTWNRLICENRRNHHGLALQAVRYPQVPVFLSPDEVVFWLNRPYEETLVTIARQWASLEDRVVDSQEHSHSGRFWQ